MKNLSRLERYQGALLGVHAGDSLGAPYEKKDRAFVAQDLQKRRGLGLIDWVDPFRSDLRWKAGRPTDDSEMTAALAISLAECGGVNLEDQYRRYRAVVHGGTSVLYDGPAEGFGRVTKTMLEFPDYHESRRTYQPPMAPSNGSLMRTSPIALRFYREPGYMIHAAKAASAVTHLNPIAGECCALYAVILAQVLEGKHRPRECIEFAFRYCVGSSVFEPAVIALRKHIFEEPIAPPDGSWRVLGSAPYSLHAACFAFAHAGSFREGIERAVGLGGDTDTYAAIAGGLLGAHFGYLAIPFYWRRGLLGAKVMFDLAARLHAQAVP